MELSFTVTLCYGSGDGGDIAVDVEVTDEEYRLLVQCYREDVEIEECEELESLYQRICAEAKGWDAELSGNSDNEDDEDYVDYDDVSCIVDFPDAFYEMPLPEEDGP